MKTKKPKLLMNGHSDEMQTPKIAIEYLLPYLKREWVIYESAWGGGSLANHLKQKGFNVIGDFVRNFFVRNNFLGEFDCIVTNPPYSIKDKFIEECYKIGKPFALLMPLTALESEKRSRLFRKYGIQLIIPNKRFNFETPSGKGSGSWFATAWFTWGLNLPKDLMFVELKEDKKLFVKATKKEGVIKHA